MNWETPSIYFGDTLAESVVWVTLDDGESWSLLKLVRVGSALDANAKFASPSAWPLRSG